MEKIAALLAHGGQIGAGDAEGVSAWRGAKATGDLLLQFRHPNVALGLVVVKRDTRIVEETQHLVGVSAQTSEEIDGAADCLTRPRLRSIRTASGLSRSPVARIVSYRLR